MSATIKFKLGSETMDLTNNDDAVKNLASLKVGDFVQVANETSPSIQGSITKISVSGDKDNVVKTVELSAEKRTFTTPSDSYPSTIVAHLFTGKDWYTLGDPGVISTYTSAPEFAFEGVTLKKPPIEALLEISENHDVRISYYINNPH